MPPEVISRLVEILHTQECLAMEYTDAYLRKVR